ncbi:MAG: transporter substrate-binding domain-containing protein [Atopobiaceae bacterium]|nr:transporter substrate-binding domain-containing protein [Atopobiaceae bacterium]
MNTQRHRIPQHIYAFVAGLLCVLALALSAVSPARAETESSATQAESSSATTDTASNSSSSANNAIYQSVSELEGKTIAYINGSVYGLAVAQRVDGTKEVYYPSLTDCVEAVRSGKADAACGISYCCELAQNRSGGDVVLVPERVSDVEEGFFFKKGSPLKAQFNEILDKLRADGTLAELQEKWVAASDEGKGLPDQDWDAPNGTLTFATSGVLEPFSYPGPNGVPYGYDVELAMLIAKELGYQLKTEMIAMDSIFAAVDSEKVDFGGTLTVTPEREEVVDFSGSVMDVGIALLVQGNRASTSNGAVPEYSSAAELSGKRIAELNGSIFRSYIDEYLPDHGEVLSFNTPSEMVAALKASKVDAVIVDEPTAQLLVARNDGITIYPEDVAQTDYGFFFPKGSDLVEKFNPIIQRLWEDGTLDSLREKWVLSDDASTKTLPEQDWDAPNGKLSMATTGLYEPMSYTGENGQVIGYDIELAQLICKELGYQLELQTYTIDGVIMGAQSGKADFGGTGATITDERAQVVDFSEPIYRGSLVFIVRDVSSGSGVGDFLSGIRESFERTFVTEDRWKLIASGLGITVLITAAASALGTIIGFALTFLRRKSSVADKLVSGFQTLMSGLPIVVVLMLLYYVVFGSLDIHGAIVAIIGFALSFAATASSNIWNSVKTVDLGQEEAALALGYTSSDSFKKVVLPQASKQFLPLLLGQIISLVKETSIVGYIAVQDLTRASDLIRSRTMEAFFPLIVTAVIYFFICWVLRRCGNHLLSRWDPQNQERTIKGVSL